MIHSDLYDAAVQKFRGAFGCEPTAAAYAPGRVEVLGNHTDYNEGFVLSAAIDLGTFFLIAPVDGSECRLVAGNLGEEDRFEVTDTEPSAERVWSNYVRGVLAGLRERSPVGEGFVGLFEGNLPLGSGLSSSAALEMSCGLALGRRYGIEIDPISLARIGQRAEHEYAGVKCGLLDQISSLFGRDGELVMSDFRSLEIGTVPIAGDVCFLMCNTHAKHELVDGEYNERREHCEAAMRYFQGVLDHPVTALRDVRPSEWQEHFAGMDPLTARRAAHPIGENTRVLDGKRLLLAGDLEGFGELMFQSHTSSMENFENSCPELDTVVAAAREHPHALGARLSGGGFGGSAVVLVRPDWAERVGATLRTAFRATHGSECDIRRIAASQGASIVTG